MNTKKLIPAALVAFAVMFVADYLWFGVVFKSWFAAHMGPQAEPNIWMHAVGEMCLAVLMAWIYPMGYKGGSTMKEGLMFGFLMGLVYQLPSSIHWYASAQTSSTVVWFFVMNGIVTGMIGGVMIAMMYSTKRSLSA